MSKLAQTVQRMVDEMRVKPRTKQAFVNPAEPANRVYRPAPKKKKAKK